MSSFLHQLILCTQKEKVGEPRVGVVVGKDFVVVVGRVIIIYIHKLICSHVSRSLSLKKSFSPILKKALQKPLSPSLSTQNFPKKAMVPTHTHTHVPIWIYVNLKLHCVTMFCICIVDQVSQYRFWYVNRQLCHIWSKKALMCCYFFKSWVFSSFFFLRWIMEKNVLAKNSKNLVLNKIIWGLNCLSLSFCLLVVFRSVVLFLLLSI